ncbi:MAG: aminopeptidase [Chlamydiae bacterium]|nr:MAG: aminopeptidase [Chlamydiota bacterium]
MKTDWIENWAKLLVNYSLKVENGSVIKVRGPVVAAELIAKVYEELLRVGAFPRVNTQLPGMSEIFFKNAKKEQLSTLSPIDLYEAKKIDGIISIGGQNNTRELSAVDPAKQVLAMKTSKPLSDIILKKNNWVITLFPTAAHAQDAQMSVADFEEFVGKAMFLDKKDSVAAWKKLSKNQQKLADRLTKTKKVRILSPDTDISLNISGRKGVNSDGHRNMPSGEAFTSPVEDSATGYICYTYPVVAYGREISGIRLEFSKGKVVKCNADKNEQFLKKMLNTDKGARFLGELGIGTNYGIQNFIKNILFDEKIGGSIHLAVGKSFDDCGGKNKSALHWDMIKDLRKDGELYFDGKLIQKNGRFIDKKLDGLNK